MTKVITVGGKVKVNGCKLKLEGYLEYAFFSYRTGKGGYFVCEASTGLALAWAPRLKSAKKEAVRRLNLLSKEDLCALVQGRIKRYGHTNKEL